MIIPPSNSSCKSSRKNRSVQPTLLPYLFFLLLLLPTCMVRTEATDMDQARQLCIVGRERNGDLVGWRRGVEAVVVVTDGLHGRCWWQLGRGREVTVNWSLKAKWCVWFSPHPCPSWTTLSTALPCLAPLTPEPLERSSTSSSARSWACLAPASVCSSTSTT
jgi:hypothetical protein